MHIFQHLLFPLAMLGLATSVVQGALPVTAAAADLADRLRLLPTAEIRRLSQERVAAEAFWQQYAQEMAIVHAAQQQGLHERGPVRLALAQARRDILLQALKDEYWTQHPVPETAITRLAEDIYAAYPEVFQRTRKIKFAHILKHIDPANPEAAQAAVATARQRVLAGEPFAAVAQEVSELPTAQQGGQVSKWFLAKPQLTADPLLQPVFALTGPGEMTEPFVVGKTVNLMMLLAETPAQRLPFQVVAKGIAAPLRTQYQAQEIRKFERNLVPEAMLEYPEGLMMELLQQRLAAPGAD